LRELRCPSGARHHDVAEDRLRTTGFYALALAAQGAGQPEAGTGQLGTDLTTLILHGGFGPAQIVLAILVIFSAVSWGVILYKIWQYGRST